MTSYQELYQAQVLDREKVFRDPVHNYIHIRDRIILQLIDTKEFQRLRRIKQLGASQYTFHGAEHSRFNHSLGVYEITRRIINNFVRNYPTKEEDDGLWDDSERLVALCSALLHDLGHGPFSHTFESIFKTDHEAITQEIILSPKTEVNAILRQMGDDFPAKVASVIQKKYPNQQVVQLISSQIDADRMDYLLRDAFYAGVSYGQYDLTRIVRVIRPYDGRIVFDFSGMHAVEDYVISRYQMYMQVYFHPVSRGMEEVIRSLLARAKYLYLKEADKLSHPAGILAPFFQQNWTLEDYLKLDDHTIISYFSHWLYDQDPILSDLCYRVLNRKPFKSLLVVDEEIEELTTALQTELRANHFDPEYYFALNKSFDQPYDSNYFNPDTKKIQIELVTKTEQLVELSQVSMLIGALRGKELGDQRLYYPREIIHQIQEMDPNDLSPNQVTILKAHAEETNDVTYHIQQRLF